MLPEAVKLVAKLAVSALIACDEDNSNVISCEAETANKACDAVTACEDDTGVKIEPVPSAKLVPSVWTTL